MSYILDALKKSEQQRPPGPVPDLFTVHGPQSPPPAPRVSTRAIAAAALLLIVTAIALWAWIAPGRRDEGPARTPAAISSQPRAEAPVAPEIPRVVAATKPQAPVRAAASTRSPIDRHSPVSAPPAQKVRAAVVSPVVAREVPDVPPAVVAPAPSLLPAASLSKPPDPVTAAPAATVPAAGEVPATPVGASQQPTPVTPAAASSASPEPATAVAAPEEVPPADGHVLNLAELPPPVRAELPKLLVSGHVWSEEPALRLLSVDDRLLHEGGEAAPGVSLQEITPAGAVFVYKGWRFRVAGGRQ